MERKDFAKMLKRRFKVFSKSFFALITAAAILCGTLFSAYDVPEVQALSPTIWFTAFEYMLGALGYAFGSRSDNDAAASAFSDWLSSASDTVEDISEARQQYQAITGQNKISVATLLGFTSLLKVLGIWKTDALDGNVYSDASVIAGEYGNGYTGAPEQVDGYFYYSGYITHTSGSEIDVLPSKKIYAFVLGNGNLISYTLSAKNDDLMVVSAFQNRSDGYKFYSIFIESISSFSSDFNVPLFDSRESALDYLLKGTTDNILNKASAGAWSPSDTNYGTLYGTGESLVDSSKTSEKEITEGDYSIVDSTASAVESARSAAEESGETVTAAEINAAVSSAISDALIKTEQNTEDIKDNTAASLTWLEKIYNKVSEIQTSLAARTDGTSALKEDVDDIRSQLKVIEGSGGNEDPDNDPDDPKPWVLGAFSVSALLKGFVEWLGDPLSRITQFQNKIKNILDDFKTGALSGLSSIANLLSDILTALQGAPELIFYCFQETLGGIKTVLDAIAESAAAVALAVQNLPALMAEQLAGLGVNVLNFPEAILNPSYELNPEFNLDFNLNLEVNPQIELNPNIELNPQITVEPAKVEFPSLDGLLDPVVDMLKNIYFKISDMFGIDIDAIQDRYGYYREGWLKKLGIDLNAMWETFSFSAIVFHREAPIIKISTPAIIHDVGYAPDEIILFDGNDFNDYVSIVRNLVRCFILVAYAYSVMCKFRVHFVV